MDNGNAIEAKKPFNIPQRLIDEILNGKCIAFIGAGLSRGAGLPDWKSMIVKMLDWSEQNNVLINARADVEKLINSNRYLDAAEFIKSRMGKEKFRRFMTEIFLHPDLQPTENHLTLSQIPFSAIATTNYEGLIEKGFAKACGTTLHTFTHADTAELSGAFTDGRFFLLKAHGTINQLETIVLTKTDYRQIIHSAPAYRDFLKTLFKTRTILFIGFSLNDPDLELLLDELHAYYDDYTRTHFALMSAAQISSVQVELYAQTHSIEIISYQPSSDKHPEVTDFLKELARQTDPKKRIFGKLLEVSRHLADDPKYHFTVSTDGSVSVGPKDPEAYNKNPASFSFSIQFDLNTSEGREAYEKWLEHQKTGGPITINTKHIKGFSLPEPFDRLVTADDLTPLELVMSPRANDEGFPCKLEFTTDQGESICFDYVELRTTQRGTDEQTFTNQQQPIPLKLELKLRRLEKVMSFRWWIDGEKELNVRQALQIQRLFHLISQGGEIRLIAVGSDLPIAISRFNAGQVIEPEAERMIRLLEALVVIQRKARVPLYLPDRDISIEEAGTIFSLARALETGHAVTTAQHLQLTLPAEKVGAFLEGLKDETPRRFDYVGDNMTPITIFDSVINLGPAVIFQDCYLTNGERVRLESTLRSAPQGELIEVNVMPFEGGIHEARLLNFLPVDEAVILRRQFPFLFREPETISQ